jgi:Protein of unknown function, DUF481
MMRRLIPLVALALLLPAVPAAAVYSDTIVLNNGDRITGEVQVLSRGQLQMKTDDIGRLVINWDRVVSIGTSDPLDVSTGDGRLFFGRLDAAPDGGIAVLNVDGTVAVTLTFLEVVGLARIRPKFLDKIDGSFDIGASYTHSSGVGQATFSLNTVYRQPRFEAGLYAYVSATSQPHEPDSQRSTLRFGYTRYRTNELIVAPLAIFESNPDLGFDFRGTGALTVGRYLARTNNGWIRFGVGGAVGGELSVEGEKATNVDALVSLNASLFAYHFPKMNIDFSLMAFPSVKGDSRIRLEASAKFKRELVKDVNFSVSAYDSYDNHPLSEEASTHDVGYALSFGWTF